MVRVWMKMVKMNLKCTETEKNDERLNYAVKESRRYKLKQLKFILSIKSITHIQN